MNIPFDIEKAKAGFPIVFRDGSPATFLAHVPEADDHCDRVVVKYGKRAVCVDTFSEDGQQYLGGDIDLFMKPTPMEYWINFYPTTREDKFAKSRLYKSREDADAGAGFLRVACVRVTFEAGDGL